MSPISNTQVSRTPNKAKTLYFGPHRVQCHLCSVASHPPLHGCPAESSSLRSDIGNKPHKHCEFSMPGYKLRVNTYVFISMGSVFNWWERWGYLCQTSRWSRHRATTLDSAVARLPAKEVRILSPETVPSQPSSVPAPDKDDLSHPSRLSRPSDLVLSSHRRFDRAALEPHARLLPFASSLDYYPYV